MNEVFGIDVAKWQGMIDWPRVNVSFAILKVTQKDNKVEGSFERNYAGATKSGIKVGGYRYVYARNIAEAKNEANAVIRACLGKNMPYGIWLDMEDKSIRNIGKDNLSAIIRTEADILTAAGFKVGIYCSKDWYYNVLDSASLKNEFSFWIARYPLVDTGKYNADSKLNPKTYAVAWQYSSKGKVPGIAGNVDMDVFYQGIPNASPVDEKTCPFYRPTALVTSKANAKKHKVKNYICKGDGVGWVQWHLDKLGYDLGKGGIDQKCGTDTVKAIIKFQTEHNLNPVDGLCGEDTKNLLGSLAHH